MLVAKRGILQGIIQKNGKRREKKEDKPVKSKVW